MKVRLGFVSNSSSSSFTIFDLNHPAVYMLDKIAKSGNYGNFDFEVDLESGTMVDLDDNSIEFICCEYDIDWKEFMTCTDYM